MTVQILSILLLHQNVPRTDRPFSNRPKVVTFGCFFVRIFLYNQSNCALKKLHLGVDVLQSTHKLHSTVIAHISQSTDCQLQRPSLGDKAVAENSDRLHFTKLTINSITHIHHQLYSL